MEGPEARRSAPLPAAAPGAHPPSAGTRSLPPLPLLATKFALPAPSSTLVSRPRLTTRLQPTPTSRLALLVAPAGSGKSWVVSEWCQQNENARIAWLSLDASDNKPTRFLLYVSAALETVAPEVAAPVLALLQSTQPAPLEYALTLLLNGLAALEQPVTLVLDDYRAIEALPVHHLLAFLLERLPPTLFLILASRSDPPLPLARLRVRGQLVELRAPDLRFTDEEATQFLNERMGLSLAPEAVARLAERTEGWIAGRAWRVSVEQAMAVFDTNFFGVLRMTQAALPSMREQGHGRIVNIGSVAGFMPMPFWGVYSASKHALEGYSETLGLEVSPFGIHVSLIQPSFIRSNIDHNTAMADRLLAAYEDQRQRAVAVLRRSTETGDPPATVARAVLSAATSPKPARRNLVGRNARILRSLRTLLPSSWFEMGLRRRFRLG